MLEQLINIDTALTLFINGSHSLWLDGFAMAVTSTMTWLPAALVLVYVIIRHGEIPNIVVTVLAIGLCILLADQIASGIFKPLVARPRPAGDPLLMLDIDVVNDYRGGRYGFFSSHAANTFAVATFVSLIVRYRLLTVTLCSWALLNCWSRIYLGVHYVGDVVCGIICGILVGLFVYYIYTRLTRSRRFAASSADIQTVTGFAIDDARLLVGTLLLLFSYCNFIALFFA